MKGRGRSRTVSMQNASSVGVAATDRDKELQTIDPLNKALGWLQKPTEACELAARGWNLLAEDLALPAAVLYQSRLQHNAAWMQRFIEAYGVKLAPHGKTTMAPALFALQMETGAWGITLATAQQVRVAYAHGIRRILMANQLIGKGNMRILSELLADPDFTFYCLVDSPEQVRQLAAFFSERSLQIRVLVELGVEDGRCGVRNQAQLDSLLAALDQAKRTVLLCGVEVYEGVLKDEAGIRSFLGRAVTTMRTLLAEGRFAQQPALLSGAGSAWYDVVADAFASAGFGPEVELVLRPGCYLTHDVGAYREAQEHILTRNPIARSMQGGLLPALHVWVYVQSVPQPDRAILAMGKRDAAFDSGLPVPALRFFPGDAAPRLTPSHWEVTKMMDQHAYLKCSEEDPPKVGEMIAFNIAHPCLTFDKWRCLPILDDDYGVTGYVQTWF
jgi:D-serine dehydratase